LPPPVGRERIPAHSHHPTALTPMPDSSAKIRTIGRICNTYGGLIVKQENGLFWWAISDWDGEEWEEIPEYLFAALNRFEDEEQKIP